MRNKSKIMSLALGAGLLITGSLAAIAADKKKAAGAKAPAAEDSFYVYSDRGSRLNHYVPSGWMGDYGDIKMNQGWAKNGKDNKDAKKESAPSNTAPAAGGGEDTCIQLKYTAERKQGAGWAGIYWQHPANNWGDKRGGFDLSPYSKLTFMAKGEVGGEVIDKFFMGGITGQTEEGDSDEASLSPVTLTKDWKKYEVSLKGLDLSHIIGGFGVAANADANPNGFTAYIDDIRFEK